MTDRTPVPLSQETKKKIPGFWATFGFGIVIGISSFAAQFLVMFIIGMVKVVSDPGVGMADLADYFQSVEGLIVSIGTIASAVAGVGVMAIIVHARMGRPLAEYVGLGNIRWKTILLSLGIAVASIIVMDGAARLLERPAPDFMFRVYSTSVWPALLWIAVVVFAPLFEEILFRGFLLEGFRHSRIGTVGAIVLTSLFWSVLHVQYGLFEIATIFALGLMLGVVRIKTGTLWSVLAIHAFVNLVAIYETANRMTNLFD